MNKVYVVMYRMGEAACSGDADKIKVICDSPETAKLYIKNEVAEYTEENGYEDDDAEVLEYKEYYYVDTYTLTAAKDVKPYKAKTKAVSKPKKKDTDPLSLERLRNSKRKIVKVRGEPYVIEYEHSYANWWWADIEFNYAMFANKTSAKNWSVIAKDHGRVGWGKHDCKLRICKFGENEYRHKAVRGNYTVVDKDGYLWFDKSGMCYIYHSYMDDRLLAAFNAAPGDKEGCSLVKIKSFEFEEGFGEE